MITSSFEYLDLFIYDKANPITGCVYAVKNGLHRIISFGVYKNFIIMIVKFLDLSGTDFNKTLISTLNNVGVNIPPLGVPRCISSIF